jgi:TetR/AcrR family fatty acid metabolism transcriptional regulator
MNCNSQLMKQALRSKEIAIRRQHILEAAAHVFSKRGYRNSSIRDVAKAAGVADGTIYNVFSNKAELLLSLLDPIAEGMAPNSLKVAPSNAEDLVESLLVERWATFTPQLLGILRAVLSEVLIDAKLRKLFFARVMVPVIKPLETKIAKLSDAGNIIASDAAVTSRALIAMFLGFILLRLIGDDEVAKHNGMLPDAAKLISAGLVIGRNDRA